MRAGGDKTTAIRDEIKYRCGGAYDRAFKPDADGDVSCRQQATTDISQAYDALTTPQEKDRLDVFLKVWRGNAFVDCTRENQVNLGVNPNKLKGQAKIIALSNYRAADKCMLASGNGTRPLVFNERNTPGAPTQFANPSEYIKWAVQMVKGGYSAGNFFPTLADRISLPKSLVDYIDSIRRNYPLLAKHTGRLFREAISQVSASERSAAMDGIVREITVWAENRKKQLDDQRPVDGDDAAKKTAKENEITKINTVIVKTFVDKVAGKDGGYKPTPSTPPLEAFSDKTGISADRLKDLDVIGEIRRIYVEALRSGRDQGIANEKPEDLGTKVAEAIKEKIDQGKYEISDSKNEFRASAVLNSDKTLQKVELGNGSVGGIPRALIDELDARNNEFLKAALGDLWNQVLAYMKDKNVDLNDPKNKKIRDDLVDGLVEALKQVTSAEKMLTFVLNRAESDKTNKIKIEPHLAVEKLFNKLRWPKFASGEKIAALYIEALEEGGAAYAGASKEAVANQDRLAEQLNREVNEFFKKHHSDKYEGKRDFGLSAFGRSSFGGYTDGSKKDINPLKYVEATESSKGLTLEGEGSVGARGGNPSTAGKFKIGYKHSIGKRTFLEWLFAFGGGYNPSTVDNPTNLPLWQQAKGKGSAAITDARIKLIHELKKLTLSESFGFIKKDMGPLLGADFSATVGSEAKDPSDKDASAVSLEANMAAGALLLLDFVKDISKPSQGSIDTSLSLTLALLKQLKLKLTGNHRYTGGGDNPTGHELFFAINPTLRLPGITVAVTLQDHYVTESGSNDLGMEAEITSVSIKLTKKIDLTLGAKVTAQLQAPSAPRAISDPQWRPGGGNGVISAPGASTPVEAYGEICATGEALRLGPIDLSPCVRGGAGVVGTPNGNDPYGFVMGVIKFEKSKPKK